jgi:hypothetical protein
MLKKNYSGWGKEMLFKNDPIEENLKRAIYILSNIISCMHLCGMHDAKQCAICESLEMVENILKGKEDVN